MNIRKNSYLLALCILNLPVLKERKSLLFGRRQFEKNRVERAYITFVSIHAILL